MDSAPRRRGRSTGPSRSGAGPRAGRGAAARVGQRRSPGTDPESDSTTGAGPRPTPARRSVSSRPAGTRPGTAPSAAASVGARRLGRIGRLGLRPPTLVAPKAGRSTRVTSQLIRQVAVLGLVFCAVALALAVPLRNYLAQRADLGVEVSRQQQRQTQLDTLVQLKAALADPAYIAAEAKRRLQYVKPGDTVYVVHAPALPAPKRAAAPVAAPTAPWYSHLWDTLADPSVTAPAGAPPASGSATPTPQPSAGTSRTGR